MKAAATIFTAPKSTRTATKAPEKQARKGIPIRPRKYGAI